MSSSAACLIATVICAVHVTGASAAGKEKRLGVEPPEILFIGDSHLSFGAGRAFYEFFGDFEKNCHPQERMKGQARAVARRRFGLMGVKATAPHHWVSRSYKLKKMICVPDPKWPVNARLYGFPHRTDGSYVQLGKDPSFPFCRRKKTGLEAAMEWADPRLLILYFMGNTIDRWANSPRAARRDVERLMRQIPDMTGCLFMTTSPVYRKSHNTRRLKAQANITAAFAKYGNRCHAVPMLTHETVAAIEGKARYFRRRRDGRVKDPYHPNLAAARLLLRLQRHAVCAGVFDALRPNLVATVHEH